MRPSDALAASLGYARRLEALAVLPFLVAVLRWNDLVRTATDPSTRFQVTFPTPHSFITLWSFLNPPARPDGAVGGTLPLVVGVGFGLLLVVSLAAFVVLTGLALAGYLGSIEEGVATGSYAFLDNVRRYGRPMVAYEALSMVVLLVLVAGGTVGTVLLPVVFAVLFVVAYLTYLAPYLVVAADLPLVDALARSATLATSRVEVVGTFVGFVVTGAVFSVPLSVLAYGNGLPGALLAAVLATPVGFLASMFFVVFARGLVGASEGSLA